jgi:signal transduction histidine kinase
MSAVEGLTIDCSVALPGDGERLGPQLETTVYRLIQEALTNVAKHARAEHARVSVSRSDGRLEIEVADDGRGFDPSVKTAGFGLAGMHERVALSGGELEVKPADPGTTLHATIPLPHDGSASDSPRLRA